MLANLRTGVVDGSFIAGKRFHTLPIMFWTVQSDCDDEHSSSPVRPTVQWSDDCPRLACQHSTHEQHTTSTWTVLLLWLWIRIWQWTFTDDELLDIRSVINAVISPPHSFLAAGVYDVLSAPSSTSDDLQQELNGSLFDEVSSGTTGGPDDQLLDEDDPDGFEVLSFNAPPESSLFFKGR